MKYLKWSLLGVVPMLAIAFWVKGSLDTEREALKAFCESTRGGEPWPSTLARARQRGFEFVRANSSAEKDEEYLAIVDTYGTGLGCRITVAKGRVVATSVGDTGKVKADWDRRP